jgi:hypothetical protein
MQNVEQKMNQEPQLIRKTDKITSQRKPPTGQQDVSIKGIAVVFNLPL